MHVKASQWLQNCIDDDDENALSKELFNSLFDDVYAMFKGLIKLLT